MPKKKLTAKEKWMEKNKPAKESKRDRSKDAPVKSRRNVEPPPEPVPGIKRGTCAFPVKPKKACGHEASPRARWCEVHREEVRKRQLAYNTAQWFVRNKEGKTEHNLWFKDRPTMAAFRDEKTLAAAKAKAKELHPDWTDKHIGSLVEKERDRLLEDGLRQNPSLKLSELKALGGKTKPSKEPAKNKAVKLQVSEITGRTELTTGKKPKPLAKKPEKKTAKKSKKAAIKKDKPAPAKTGMIVEAPKPAPKVESSQAASGMTVPGLNLGTVPA